MEEKFISIYTDGACRGNPGPGGWGVLIILENNIKKELLDLKNLPQTIKKGTKSRNKSSKLFQ